MTTIKFDDYLNSRLSDPQFKAGFEAESSKLDSAIAIMKARESAGLTQRELADLAKVPQSTIARIELGSNTSLNTLTKIAAALGKKVKIKLL